MTGRDETGVPVRNRKRRDRVDRKRKDRVDSKRRNRVASKKQEEKRQD